MWRRMWTSENDRLLPYLSEIWANVEKIFVEMAILHWDSCTFLVAIVVKNALQALKCDQKVQKNVFLAHEYQNM